MTGQPPGQRRGPPERRPGGRPVAALGAPRVAMGPLDDAAVVSTLGMRAPHYLHALRGADARGRVVLWTEIGDALGAMGRWDRARLAWERGLSAAEGQQKLRPEASSLYWRLGQLGEGLGQLDDAMGWYERAADAFRKDEAHADEARARMALARCAYHLRGGGEARQHVRDAVLAVREAHEATQAAGEAIGAEDLTLLGEALEMSGEVALDLGQHEEAVAALRDALKQHERARMASGAASGSSSDEVRTLVALADALLESGQVLAAVTTYESVQDLVEGHELPETRGRGMAILGLVNLELGRVAEAAEPLRQAHEWLMAAGATLRGAKLHVATGRRVERLSGPEAAREHYERAWVLAQTSRDELRLAPIAYSLARCYVRIGDWVRADETIERALILVQNHADLEGLERCTDLAVRIAIKLAQGRLALDRLLLLARTRGRLGERVGEALSLKAALMASVAVPGLDPAPVAKELMECLRQVGVEALGPQDAEELAKSLEKAGLLENACEIAVMEAERDIAEGRHGDGARALAKAAVLAFRAKDRWGAVELWDRAIDLGDQVGLPEVEHWSVERTIAAES